MKVNVVMPKMGESINEGTIIKWHKKTGDIVKKDEIIYEISTDKVDTEIPCSENGILIEINVLEQETVEVGTVVAVIETEPGKESEQIKEAIVDEKLVFAPSTEQVGGELIDIPMPKMGESIMEGTVIKWYKQVGDIIKLDETIFEISTDKVDTEVPSPVEGIMTEILVGENSTVPVGTVVARIKTNTGIVRKPIVKEESKLAIKENIVNIEEPKVDKIKNEKTDINSFFSPLVLSIANKENIPFDELQKIAGTGIKNRVTKNDILNYLKYRTDIIEIKTNMEKPSPVISPKIVSYSNTNSDIEVIPMNNIRQKIMTHMLNSRDTSVHVSAVIEVDMLKIHNYIQQNKASILQKEGIKITYLPFIAYAVIKALKEFPFINASINGKDIILKKYINLGIAVAVEPNGLIVPNIKNADEKNIRGLSKSITELSTKARSKGLVPDDIMNGTFTITNYGVFGSLFGTPIINQPEVAILGVGTITKKPVVVEIEGMDTIAIKPMMYLSLSHDHRLVDGMLGGKFLKYIKDTLENFDTNIV
ncbi:MAG: 2-oxo acid dehydrogenase subunit E2 [bacterium]